MEDFFEKYIEKEQIINDACTCIEANSCSKLQSEISEIKNTISKLTLDDSWQDLVGDTFANVISKCVSTLEKIENSIASDFASSEKIYLLIKTELLKLKQTNELYKNYSSRRPSKPYGINITEYDLSNYNMRLRNWEEQRRKYRSQCIELSSQIDSNFKKLDDINEIDISDNKTINLPSLKTTISDFANTISNLGKFVSSDNYGVYGYIVSSIDGMKHTIFNQTQIEGWKGDCNRAAAASIASGVTTDAWAPINEANRTGDGIGYNNEATKNYFSKFGLSSNVRRIDNSYDTVKNDIVSSLTKGDYVMFDMSEANVKGRSGQTWTGTRHWVSVLDIRKNGDSYEIFVSDSGHGGSTVDHGMGEGWYSIDEFDGKKIANLTTVSRQTTNATTLSTATANISNNQSEIKYTTDIPENIRQSGYTVTGYDKWIESGNEMNWANGTNQREVSDVWKEQGSNFKNGIAVINDNGKDKYLIATSSKYGKVGDSVTVNFDDGSSIDCIIADQKSSSDSNYSEYGHKYGGSTNILEFEVERDTFKSNGNPTTDTWGLDWDSSSRVASIDNHGSILKI